MLMADDNAAKASGEATWLAQEYYRRLDANSGDVLDLFSDTAQLYFPKCGIVTGKAGFQEILGGLGSVLARLGHHSEAFHYIVSGNTVVVEGTTEGDLQNGTSWKGGETAGGRFCSVFETKDGLITRMHVYLDPDYGSQDKERFLWPLNPPRQW